MAYTSLCPVLSALQSYISGQIPYSRCSANAGEPEFSLKSVTAVYSGTSDVRLRRSTELHDKGGVPIKIVGYTRVQSSMTIPSEIDGKDVTRIADGAFENCIQLKSLLN